MNVGIIGIGKIGRIILNQAKGIFSKENIFISNRTTSKIECYKDIATICSNAEVVKNSDIIYLCVHPNEIVPVLEEIKDDIKKDTVFISAAAGLKISKINTVINNEIVRILPNTPLNVGNGVIFYTKCSIESHLKDMFLSISKLYLIDEELMDVSSVSCGSLPAYVYYLISLWVNNATLNGLDPKIAREGIAQTVIGAAKYVKESDKDFESLIDEVCSKGGSTIEGLECFINNNLKEVIDLGFNACLNKTKKLGD